MIEMSLGQFIGLALVFIGGFAWGMAVEKWRRQ